MEERPRINQENFIHPPTRLEWYKLIARMDLAADLYLMRDVDERLDQVDFETPSYVIRQADYDAQLEWLDSLFETRVAEARREWQQSKDDEQWDEMKEEFILWYQKGLQELDLLTDGDKEDFARLYRSDKFVRARYTDSDNQKGSHQP